MRILIVNTYDKVGGAAIATHRLFKELSKLKKGCIDYFVKNKTIDDENIITISSNVQPWLNKLYTFIDYLPSRFIKIKENSFGSSTSICPTNFDAFLKKNQSKYSLVHLNYITNGFISIRTLNKINVPIVWTLHDMWPILGREHYTLEETLYKNSGKGTGVKNKSIGFIDRFMYRYKLKHLQSLKNLTIVTPSSWLSKIIDTGLVFNGKEIVTIKNGIDLNQYYPVEKSIARKKLGLKENGIYFLFGAYDPSDRIKGFHLIIKVIQFVTKMKELKEYELLLFGSDNVALPDDIKQRIFIHNYGRVNNEETLSLLYSAADLFFMGSVLDNLPNTAIESIACGTPVIAFDVGGLGEIIRHEYNGYLIKPYDIEEYANCIIHYLHLSIMKKNDLRNNARKYAIENYDINNTATEYLKLYQDILRP